MAIVRDARQALPAARFDLEVRKRYAAQIGTLDAKRLALKHMDICDWAESNFYLNSTSAPIKLTLWQKGIVRMATHRVAERFQYTTVLYGTVKKSGKSTIGGLVARWTAETQTRFGEVYCLGNDSDQARDRAMKEAKFSIQMTPGYLHGRDVLPGRWKCLENSLRCMFSGSMIKAVAVDAKGEAGGHPALTVWTELWGFESQDALRFWDEMTQDPTQPDSVRWVETYAGYDGESTLLYGLYSTATEKGHQLTNGEFAARVCRDVDGERYEDFLHCWDNDRWGDDIHGNPDAPVPIYTLDEAGLFTYWDEGVTARRFEWQDERYYREQAASLPGASFLRFHENLWVGGESDYIPMALWDQCDDPELHDDGKHALLPDVYDGNGHRIRGEAGVMSCDAGVSNDCFAIVFTTRHPLDKKIPAIRKVKVFKPKDFGPGANYPESPADRIDFNVVEQWIRDICKSYNVVQICYDPWQLEDMMQRLSRERVSWTAPFSQGKERHEADRGLHDRVMQGKLAHAGDVDLRQHIQNAKAKIQKDEESKMKIIKKSDLRKIDAAVCASMGVARVMWLNLG